MMIRHGKVLCVQIIKILSSLITHIHRMYKQYLPLNVLYLNVINTTIKPFLDSANILDVAKKAGYTTSWFSNQGVFGEYDTAISLMAKTADTTKWSHESYAFSDRYDESLLPLLQSVDPNKNNFIVIHIMGSHIYYNDRYPHEFSKWKQGPYPDGQEAYANSPIIYRLVITTNLYLW